MSNKNPKLETTSVKKLITSYFPGLESQFGNKIKIDNGVGTGSVVKVNTQDITILLYGDVDKDAEVTEHDAYKIVKTGTGLENLTDAICEKAGDVDGDGELTENDAFIIVKYSVGNAEFNKVTVHTLVTSNFVVDADLDAKSIVIQPLSDIGVHDAIDHAVAIVKSFAGDNIENMTVKDISNKLFNKEIVVNDMSVTLSGVTRKLESSDTLNVIVSKLKNSIWSTNVKMSELTKHTDLIADLTVGSDTTYTVTLKQVTANK